MAEGLPEEAVQALELSEELDRLAVPYDAIEVFGSHVIVRISAVDLPEAIASLSKTSAEGKR